MGKKKKSFTFIKNGIFHGYILFSCGYSYDEILAKLKKAEYNDWHDAFDDAETKELLDKSKYCATSFYDKEVKYSIIFFRDKFSFNNFDYIALAHEIIHLIQFNLVEYLDRNKEHECEAYFHSYFMRECLESFNK